MHRIEFSPHIMNKTSSNQCSKVFRVNSKNNEMTDYLCMPQHINKNSIIRLSLPQSLPNLKIQIEETPSCPKLDSELVRFDYVY